MSGTGMTARDGLRRVATSVARDWMVPLTGVAAEAFTVLTGMNRMRTKESWNLANDVKSCGGA